MKHALSAVLTCVLLLASCGVLAEPNYNVKWGFHVIGPHDAEANTCDFVFTDCSANVTYASAPGRYDIYILAHDVHWIASARYGLCCDGPFYFYGWSSCSDSETPTSGWPGCNEGTAQTWGAEQFGPHVTLGLIDVYAYGGISRLMLCPDPRVDYAEVCDGATPSPSCAQRTHASLFGMVGFNRLGYDSCQASGVPVEDTSWGLIKALYR